ncbi:MAG: bifunctional tRNA (5-methylaminomethyl-2-thiouridine)(34)-methyltransferase MnmD/FAD-dependent 5-carboxymethylaminomethyl-2-thiouridine(34) oxidoreductase MnmC [Pseudomonadota bacterium]
MSRRQRIDYAELDWGAGAPRSLFFDDIYFSGDGRAESDFVFLRGNDLPARFAQKRNFTIGELGFGAGLNFLTTWRAWQRASKPKEARLHFLSFEAFPLSPEAMQHAHKAWPDLAPLSARLRSALPPPQAGFHQISLDAGVTLTLFYGDVANGLPASEARVDAWYLDGFSPAKNPAMWTSDVFAQIARLSAPGASFATFTVAGAVRREAERAGFSIAKRPGFGRKREMLTGTIKAPAKTQSPTPWFDNRRATPFEHSARIAIIGAGVAGASLCYELKRLGYEPVVMDAKGPASGASGNPAGLIMPRLDVGETPAGQFHVSAYLHTVRLLMALQAAGAKDLFMPCGVRFHAKDARDQERHERLLERGVLAEGWLLQEVERLHLPQGGVVDPPRLVEALLNGAPIIRAKVDRLERVDDGWRVHTRDGGFEEFDVVIVANAVAARMFEQMRMAPLQGVAGQIDYFEQAAALDSAHAFGPYAAPTPRGGLIVGATYAPGAEAVISEQATSENLDAVVAILPELGVLEPSQSTPRASQRCATPDRMPIAGPLPDDDFYRQAYKGLRTGRRETYPVGQSQPGLYALTGLGSRGLVTAPLCAALLASDLAGSPSPVTREIANALHPARFLIRALKRNEDGLHGPERSD